MEGTVNFSISVQGLENKVKLWIHQMAEPGSLYGANDHFKWRQYS